MAPYVDEIHIAEGTRDFSGARKKLLWPSLAKSGDALIAKFLHKITYHAVEVPPNATSYDIQKSVLAAQLKVPGRGVMLEGDLDEIVRREVLQAVRACEPADGSGWNANVQMKIFVYSLAWGGSTDWANPPLMREFGLTGSGPATSLAQVAARVHGMGQVGHKRYIRNAENHIVMTDGRTAGWHLGWACDGAEGIAEKILHGHIEGTPAAFAPYAGNRDTLVEFLRDKSLPNPKAYQPDLVRSNLKWDGLPQAIRDDPDLFRSWLGDLELA
uniref:Uncharacterized protein n=1 Tax=Zooxanthella nutricula TaxID=1333877 RepID=A0A7S2NFQ4_9DINO|mmetsp:Transcript_2651/g.7961  ORF Transcript_2651/g.7961 Transcript_2651/m.7961 type:complete len:271 (+) Transcript_2651:190-1002(+)